MADVLTGVTEIDSVSLADISAQAQLYLQQQSIMLGKATDYSRFAVKGAKSVDIGRAPGFTVGDKGENATVDAQALTWNADTIAFDQHRVVQFLLEDIASGQSRIALESENILRAAADLARDIDQKIITELETVSTGTPDHDINFATADTVTEAEILNARKLLIEQFLNPAECFIGISPTIEASMLEIENFVKANEYGSANPVQRGVIGTVYGLKVFVHNDVTGMVVFHPTAAGYAFQWMTRVQNDMDLPNLAMRYSLDYLGGFQYLDPGTAGTKRAVKYTNV